MILSKIKGTNICANLITMQAIWKVCTIDNENII